jgi:hypothetical protein
MYHLSRPFDKWAVGPAAFLDASMRKLVHDARKRYEHSFTSMVSPTAATNSPAAIDVPTEAAKSRIHFFDTYPLYFRPDAHISEEDCLHYCLPGALNVEANIFLTKLYTGEY